jgi:hypothetical protein
MSDSEVIETGESPSSGDVVKSSKESNQDESDEGIRVEEELSEEQIEEVEEDESDEEQFEEEDEEESLEEDDYEPTYKKQIVSHPSQKPINLIQVEEAKNESFLKKKYELSILNTYNSIQLINELKKANEELFLTKDQYKKEKEAFEWKMADQNTLQKSLERRIQQLENENSGLKLKLIHSQKEQKFYEAQYKEAIKRNEETIRNTNLENLSSLSSQTEFDSLSIGNQLLKNKIEEYEQRNNSLVSEVSNLKNQVRLSFFK